MTRPADIAPEVFERLVALVMGEEEFSNAEIDQLLRNPANYACFCELDAVWRLSGGMDPLLPPSSDPQ